MEITRVINEVKNQKKEIILLMVYLITASMYIFFNKPDSIVYNLEIYIDKIIPFTKEFIIFYYSWYVFLPMVIISLYLKSREDYFKLLIGFSLGMLMCYLIYSIFQTTVPRPLIEENDFFSILTKKIYENDNPYNCFPSIHVFTTAYGCFVMRKSNFKDSFLFRNSLNVLGILIILSTLFVKQHVFMDAIGGITAAYLVYRLMYKPEGEKILKWIRKQYSLWMMKRKLGT
ncbi:phosphatase PAP2 family protein [Clostridium polynesiense]|uniref:phosphatase PAP2 family protein n=1 Tax=Clostridium polynesiense TaxID=1325933 RepID=UPI00058D1EC4|nr:phosphatase PAP2 family protein [Clostridium polynesiense]